MALPLRVTRAPMRTIRPAMLADVYPQPRTQLRRLAERGELLRLAHGYYCVRPDTAGPRWSPTIEAAAGGIATSIFGARDIVVMGLSAARLLGGYPRAIADATVATPRQHAPVDLLYSPARIRFVRRATASLDATLEQTELGAVLTTTPEQTVLDLTRRPTLALSVESAEEAVRNLLPRCDRDVLEEIAADQRMMATLRRLDRQHPAS